MGAVGRRGGGGGEGSGDDGGGGGTPGGGARGGASGGISGGASGGADGVGGGIAGGEGGMDGGAVCKNANSTETAQATGSTEQNAAAASVARAEPQGRLQSRDGPPTSVDALPPDSSDNGATPAPSLAS